jgi:uncharacterized protein
MHAQEHLVPWVDALRGDIDGLQLHDAHVHVGLHDPSGYLATEDEVEAALGAVDSRALVFPLAEPDGYREANELMLAFAARHDGRLHALCRLDPADDPLGEAERLLDAGAVGIKLHPRGEGFDIDDARLDDVFALADERRLPIMIHAGVGAPAVGPHTVRRAAEHPGARFILAHCAIGAFERVLPHAGDLPNLFFDTSWWNPGDIWGLLRLVNPGQILYASDIPFASPAQATVVTGRLALQAGLSPEQCRSIMGGQLARLVAHEDPVDVGPVPQEAPSLPPELERLYVTLCTTVEPMLRGADPGHGLELARVCAQTPNGPHADVIRAIDALLTLAEQEDTPDPLRPVRTPGFDLVLAAAVIARTPAARLPERHVIDAVLA